MAIVMIEEEIDTDRVLKTTQHGSFFRPSMIGRERLGVYVGYLSQGDSQVLLGQTQTWRGYEPPRIYFWSWYRWAGSNAILYVRTRWALKISAAPTLHKSKGWSPRRASYQWTSKISNVFTLELHAASLHEQLTGFQFTPKDECLSIRRSADQFSNSSSQTTHEDVGNIPVAQSDIHCHTKSCMAGKELSSKSRRTIAKTLLQDATTQKRG